MVGFQDLAPNFAGTLYGIGRTLADGATGFVVPSAIGAITSNSLTTPRTWRVVFGLAAAVYCTGAAAFVLLYRDCCRERFEEIGDISVLS